MYLVTRWYFEDGTFGGKNDPVLALRSTASQHFTKEGYPTSWPYEQPSAELLIEDGWSFQGFDVGEDAIILDDEYGFIDAKNSLLNSSNSASKLVLCPWPSNLEQDTAEIAKYIPTLNQMAKKNSEADKKRLAKLTEERAAE